MAGCAVALVRILIDSPAPPLLCREAGLALDELKGMSYNPLRKTYALNSDTSVNYMLACRKPL